MSTLCLVICTYETTVHSERAVTEGGDLAVQVRDITIAKTCRISTKKSPRRTTLAGS